MDYKDHPLEILNRDGLDNQFPHDYNSMNKPYSATDDALLTSIPTTLTTYTILRKLFKGLKQAPSAGMICCPFFLETITSQKAQLDPYSVHPRRRQVCQYGISIGGTSSQKHLARESEFEFLINKLECGDLHGYAETIADEVDE
ncbi:hypothetical protein Tco_1384856 [Tanacetum coccineum]